MDNSSQNIYIQTLPCGVKFAFKRAPSPVAYCALSIHSGTRHEPEELPGTAHFTEHMLFKGTSKHCQREINNRLERLGGELNAFTTKEETVVHSTTLKEDISKSADLLFEIVLSSTFPEKELVKERSVILDEINMYKDSPAERIYDEFEELLFGSHPLSRPILGNAKSLKKISTEDLRSYAESRFIPHSLCFTAVADMAPDIVVNMVEKAFLRHYNGRKEIESPLQAISGKESSLDKGALFHKEVSRKNHQAHCVIGTSAYSLYDKSRLTLLLLCNMLGGPSSNSRLNQRLRERSALVYTVESSYTQYSDTGTFAIYFGCDKGDVEKCLSLTEKEIGYFRDGRMTEAQLKSAKKQLLGQHAISSDNGEVQALSMGKSLLSYGNVMPDSEIRRLIEEISAEEIRRVACEVLAPERFSTLIYR
ncbi:MAG: insulinase family protein [Bacteroidales bacterium]|nr:insulinase family protein [Bacteroidales bacterium]